MRKRVLIGIVAVSLVVFVAALGYWRYMVAAGMDEISQRVYTDTTGRDEVPCQAVPGAAVVLVFGQSNATNEGQGPYIATGNVVNFDYINGRCYKAKDPLIGTSGSGGGFATRLGDLLVSEAKYPQVILLNMAAAGAYIRDWVKGGRNYHRFEVARRSLRTNGLTPTHFLWHQGEADAGAGTSTEDYRRMFMSMIGGLRDMGFLAPVYVAVATMCGPQIYPDIRSAQRELPDPALGIFPGPDTDLIGPEFRFDTCHMDSNGLDRHAEMWFEAITR